MTESDDINDFRKDKMSGRFNSGSTQEDDGSDGDNQNSGDTAAHDDAPEEVASGDDEEQEEKWVNMKIPVSLANELDLRYRRMDLEARESDGEPIEKNSDFYPEILRIGLEGVTLERVQGNEDSEE